MIYLILSIISSSLIYVVFKFLGRFKVKTLHALIFNYFTAFLLGLALQSKMINPIHLPEKSWFLGSIILGVLFIVVFTFMVRTTQEMGMSVVSVASKMSVAVPVIFVIFYYSEPVNALKIIGILLALVAVYLVSLKNKKGLKFKSSYIWLPFVVFLGSGTIESSLKFLEEAYVPNSEIATFSATIFLFAAITGVIVYFYQSIKKSMHIKTKAIIGGVCLGIPNYFSIHFFIQALKSNIFDGSIIFIINNVAIVLLSTLIGILVFKETLLKKNWIGILFAILSIIIVYFSSQEIS
ncbi:MAG: EamA family transporter [Bacteroidota bacterium]